MSTIKLQAVITPPLTGKRLDQALVALFPQHSRSRLKQWVLAGNVLLDDQVVTPKTKVHANQTIHIQAEIMPETQWTAEDIPLDIIHQDEHLIVINKPAGLVVHPAPGNRDGTLVNALLHHFPELARLPRAGIIHRIDKDTTGLLAIARTLEAHTKLVNMLQERHIHRHYLALVEGCLIAGSTIDAPISRHPRQRTKMAVVSTGKPAITHYRIAQRFRAHTLLDVTLETGRTHQIRVHCAHINHPIVGDRTYGGRLKIPKNCTTLLKGTLQSFPRQALHAKKLNLTHPITDEILHFTAPMPEDMLHLLRVLEEDNNNV